MRLSAVILAAFCVVSLGTVDASACSAERTYAWAKAVSYASDGSFSGAGRGAWGHGQGRAVVDVGEGRVAQRITFGAHGCHGLQHLFFMNCVSGEGIVLEGNPPGPDEVQIAGALYTSIERIQPPNGPIRITANQTVEQLRSVAESNGIDYSTDLQTFFGKNEFLKRIKYNRACATHYPDLKGAK